MSRTQLVVEVVLSAAHASGDMHAHSHYSLLANLLSIGRQYASALIGFSKTSIRCSIRVACRIFYNVKQNAYRCLPPGGNSRGCCSW